MGKHLYEKHLTESDLMELTVHEIKELRSKEQIPTLLVMALLTFSFVLFIILTAALFWTNKITMFLSVIVGIPTIILYVLLYKGVSKYYATVEEYRSLANERRNENYEGE